MEFCYKCIILEKGISVLLNVKYWWEEKGKRPFGLQQNG